MSNACGLATFVQVNKIKQQLLKNKNPPYCDDIKYNITLKLTLYIPIGFVMVLIVLETVLYLLSCIHYNNLLLSY